MDSQGISQHVGPLLFFEPFQDCSGTSDFQLFALRFNWEFDVFFATQNDELLLYLARDLDAWMEMKGRA